MARISQDDSGAVVIIGSGAGGGTLAHELTRRGIKVVLLEAGARQSLDSFSQVPGDAFGQLTWLEPRTVSGTTTVAQDYPTLPSWTCKTVGGTTVHYEGTATMKQIADYARGFGGVMIWELTQDTFDDHSLLKVIQGEL